MKVKLGQVISESNAQAEGAKEMLAINKRARAMKTAPNVTLRKAFVKMKMRAETDTGMILLGRTRAQDKAVPNFESAGIMQMGDRLIYMKGSTAYQEAVQGQGHILLITDPDIIMNMTKMGPREYAPDFGHDWKEFAAPAVMIPLKSAVNKPVMVYGAFNDVGVFKPIVTQPYSPFSKQLLTTTLEAFGLHEWLPELPADAKISDATRAEYEKRRAAIPVDTDVVQEAAKDPKSAFLMPVAKDNTPAAINRAIKRSDRQAINLGLAMRSWKQSKDNLREYFNTHIMPRNGYREGAVIFVPHNSDVGSIYADSFTSAGFAIEDGRLTATKPHKAGMYVITDGEQATALVRMPSMALYHFNTKSDAPFSAYTVVINVTGGGIMTAACIRLDATTRNRVVHSTDLDDVVNKTIESRMQLERLTNYDDNNEVVEPAPTGETSGTGGTATPVDPEIQDSPFARREAQKEAASDRRQLSNIEFLSDRNLSQNALANYINQYMTPKGDYTHNQTIFLSFKNHYGRILGRNFRSTGFGIERGSVMPRDVSEQGIYIVTEPDAIVSISKLESMKEASKFRRDDKLVVAAIFFDGTQTVSTIVALNPEKGARVVRSSNLFMGLTSRIAAQVGLDRSSYTAWTTLDVINERLDAKKESTTKKEIDELFKESVERDAAVQAASEKRQRELLNKLLEENGQARSNAVFVEGWAKAKGVSDFRLRDALRYRDVDEAPDTLSNMRSDEAELAYSVGRGDIPRQVNIDGVDVFLLTNSISFDSWVNKPDMKLINEINNKTNGFVGSVVFVNGKPNHTIWQVDGLQCQAILSNAGTIAKLKGLKAMEAVTETRYRDGDRKNPQIIANRVYQEQNKDAARKLMYMVTRSSETINSTVRIDPTTGEATVLDNLSNGAARTDTAEQIINKMRAHGKGTYFVISPNMIRELVYDSRVMDIRTVTANQNYVAFVEVLGESESVVSIARIDMANLRNCVTVSSTMVQGKVPLIDGWIRSAMVANKKYMDFKTSRETPSAVPSFRIGTLRRMMPSKYSQYELGYFIKTLEGNPEEATVPSNFVLSITGAYPFAKFTNWESFLSHAMPDGLTMVTGTNIIEYALAQLGWTDYGDIADDKDGVIMIVHSSDNLRSYAICTANEQSGVRMVMHHIENPRMHENNLNSIIMQKFSDLRADYLYQRDKAVMEEKDGTAQKRRDMRAAMRDLYGDAFAVGMSLVYLTPRKGDLFPQGAVMYKETKEGIESIAKGRVTLITDLEVTKDLYEYARIPVQNAAGTGYIVSVIDAHTIKPDAPADVHIFEMTGKTLTPVATSNPMGLVLVCSFFSESSLNVNKVRVNMASGSVIVDAPEAEPSNDPVERVLQNLYGKSFERGMSMVYTDGRNGSLVSSDDDGIEIGTEATGYGRMFYSIRSPVLVTDLGKISATMLSPNPSNWLQTPINMANLIRFYLPRANGKGVHSLICETVEPDTIRPLYQGDHSDYDVIKEFLRETRLKVSFDNRLNDQTKDLANAIYMNNGDEERAYSFMSTMSPDWSEGNRILLSGRLGETISVVPDFDFQDVRQFTSRADGIYMIPEYRDQAKLLAMADMYAPTKYTGSFTVGLVNVTGGMAIPYIVEIGTAGGNVRVHAVAAPADVTPTSAKRFVDGVAQLIKQRRDAIQAEAARLKAEIDEKIAQDEALEQAQREFREEQQREEDARVQRELEEERLANEQLAAEQEAARQAAEQPTDPRTDRITPRAQPAPEPQAEPAPLNQVQDEEPEAAPASPVGRKLKAKSPTKAAQKTNAKKALKDPNKGLYGALEELGTGDHSRNDIVKFLESVPADQPNALVDFANSLEFKEIMDVWEDLDSSEIQDVLKPEWLHDTENRDGMPVVLQALDVMDAESGYERGYVFFLSLYTAYSEAADYAAALKAGVADGSIDAHMLQPETLDMAESLGMLTTEDVDILEG